MTRHDNVVEASQSDLHVPRDWARLIHKLRWIGLEDEARELEFAVSTLPPEERRGVCVGQPSTD